MASRRHPHPTRLPLPGAELPVAVRGVIVLLFIVIFVAIVLVWQNARIMRQQILDDFNQQQLVLARQAASQIEDRVNTLKSDLTGLSQMASHARLSPFQLGVALQESCGQLHRLGVVSLWITDATGSTVVRCGPKPHGLVLDSVHVQPSSQGRWQVLTVIATTFNGGPSHGRRLFAEVNVSDLVHPVTSVTRSGRTGYAWVIDGNEIFLDHPNGRFIGHDAFNVRRRRAPEINFASINQIMRDRMLTGQEGTGRYVSGWHRGTVGRMTKLIAYAPIRVRFGTTPRLWSVAVVAPETEVAKAVHRVFVRHVVAGAILVSALILLAAVVAVWQRRISAGLERRVKRTQANLEEAERIYRRLVEQASDLIYMLDLEMRVVLANAKAVELFGRISPLSSSRGETPRRELFIGRRLEELLRPGDIEFLKRQIDTVLECRRTVSYAHTVHDNGTKVQLSTKLVPIRNDEGDVHYVLGISRDVTERMEMDQRIYNAEKLASIGTLAAGVAHEINNPLALILGFTDLIREQLGEDCPAQEDLRVIEEQALLAKRVVENLLGFARVTEGFQNTTDVRSAVTAVLNVVRNTLMTRKIILDTRIPEDLPRIKIDGREFQQVLFNLITNAVAAMGEDGGTVTLLARAETETVIVTVTDTGTGIPLRIQPRIFDPFFTTKKVGEGTGLGLSLCYGIVKKHGGSLTFESVSEEDTPGATTGTTFHIVLPIDVPMEVTDATFPAGSG